jgi:hypothetical protein
MTAGWGGRVRPATHLCPGCHGVQVPNRLFACRPCWDKLSASVKAAIYATVGKMNRARIDAIQAAREEWDHAPE